MFETNEIIVIGSKLIYIDDWLTKRISVNYFLMVINFIIKLTQTSLRMHVYSDQYVNQNNEIRWTKFNKCLKYVKTSTITQVMTVINIVNIINYKLLPW